jgi:hypothetical protein
MLANDALYGFLPHRTPSPPRYRSWLALDRKKKSQPLQDWLLNGTVCIDPATQVGQVDLIEVIINVNFEPSPGYDPRGR